MFPHFPKGIWGTEQSKRCKGLCKSRQAFPAKMIRNRRICPNLGLARPWATSPVSGRAPGALGFHLPGQGSGWTRSSRRFRSCLERVRMGIREAMGMGGHSPHLPRNPSAGLTLPICPALSLGVRIAISKECWGRVTFSHEVGVSARLCARWGVI